MHVLERFPITEMLSGGALPRLQLSAGRAVGTVLDCLEEALVGQRSLLPVSPENEALLARSQRSGHAIDPQVALVVATSGSTGTPKGAMLTAANVVSSADATHQALGGEGRWLLALPAHHIAGLQVLVRSLVAGEEPAVMDVRHGFDIRAFAEAAGQLQGRCYTSLTPMQLLKAMDSLDGIDALRRFTAVLVGGAPLRDKDREAARALGINPVSTYGSSETSGGCVYDGTPIPGARVRVRGGRIALGGPMVAAGYRNLPDHEAFAEPGWFLTSDAGSLHHGTLTVEGRLDSIIDTGGLKLHPEVLERRLLNVEGVRACCVVGIPDRRLGQAIALAYEGTAAPGAIIEALDEMPRWQLPREIQRVEALPLIGPGKVDRKAVQAMLSDAR